MKNTALLVLCLAAILVMSSCGINPPTEFLGAPEIEFIKHSVFAPPSITFAHNVADNDVEEFLGYEVYYKFYQYSPTPASGGFGNDLATIDADFSRGPGNLLAAGFRRVLDADMDMLPPLIKVDSDDAGTNFDVVLTFPDKAVSPLPAKAEFLEAIVTLLRPPEVKPDFTESTFESDDMSAGDLDIPTGIPPTDDRIHLGIVILAYGRDVTVTFQPIYSEPLMVEVPLELPFNLQ